MAFRDWNRSSAMYANGSSTSNVTLFPYRPADDLSYTEQTVWTPALFYGQVIAMPVTMLITPPWTTITNRGDYVPPSYTAVEAAPNDAAWFQPHKFTP
jgi:hypothetical protein